ncbi:hypothetical protein ACFX12_032463 [Malus domestica]
MGLQGSERELVTIEVLCRVLKGCTTFVMYGLTVPLMVKTIMKISKRVTEYMAEVLLSLCWMSKKSQNEAVGTRFLTQVREMRVRRNKGLDMRE